MKFIMAFVIASFSGSDERISKPFNPMLGETYEIERASFRMVAEQVSHHPPISAFYAEGQNFTLHGWMEPTIKFTGQTIDVTNEGYVTLTFPQSDDTWTWSLNEVTTKVNNLMFGVMWIEHLGKINIRDHKTNCRAVIALLPTDSKKRYVHRVEGFVKDPRGRKKLFVYGKYSEFIKAVDIEQYRKYALQHPEKFDGRLLSYFAVPRTKMMAYPEICMCKENGKEHPINIPNSEYVWMASDAPSYRDLYYHFSYFAMTLNEIEPGMQPPATLCPTDSRLRPDIRLLEEGKVKEAEKKKLKMEQWQRAREKAKTVPYQPRWFRRGINEYTQADDWLYNGLYWNRHYGPDAELKDMFK